MRVQTENVTFQANVALAPYLRVKLSSGKLVVADATDADVGTLFQRVLAADDRVAVVPANMPGTIRMVAGAAIAQWANVYGAASGKIDDIVNSNFIGFAMEAATGDGSHIEVMRQVDITPPVSNIDGDILLDDDFLGDYPAAATAFDLGSPWIKVETLGLGVIESAEANGVLKLVFDAVAEAATAALYQTAKSFDIDQAPIFECRLAIFDIGDDVALDINFGLADATHATDFDSVPVAAVFHLNGNDLSVFCESDDGTNETVATDTTIDLVDDTYANFRIDVTDKADVKFYINGARVLAGTTFDISAYTGLLMPIVHVEKSSNNTTADVRVDRIRVQAGRN